MNKSRQRHFSSRRIRVIPALLFAGTILVFAGLFSACPPSTPVDTTPPNLTITSPVNGATYDEGTTVTLSGTFTDESSVEVSYAYSFGGTRTLIGTTSPFSYDLTLSEGDYSIYIFAEDSAGNIRYSSVDFSIEAAALGAPVFAYPEGAYNLPIDVTITAEGADSIYYTTDGTDPTTASTLYASAVTISTDTTLKAISANTDGDVSSVTEADYTNNDALLDPPANVQADDITLSSFEISWDAVTGADSYTLYRSSAANGTYALYESGIASSPHEVTGLTLSADGDYYYTVAAVSGGTPGGMSEYVHVVLVPDSDGKVKVANSWGLGFTGDDNGDGFYYITYDCLKANNVFALFHEDKPSYTPTTLAVFEMDHDCRSDCLIEISIGNPASPQATKAFNDFNLKGGNADFPSAFPSNRLVLDISEYAGLLDSYDVYISITDDSTADGGSNLTGSMTYFAVEKYSTYSYTSPSPILTLSSATALPLSTVNGSTVSAVVETEGNYGSVPASASASRAFAPSLVSSHIMTASDVARMKADIGVAEPGKNYNKIIDGHGTGLRPPTENEWEAFTGKARLVDGLNYLPGPDGYAQSVDLSESIYFPPIGNQGGQGACVAWATGYYSRTFEEALDNGWDLSTVTYGGTWPGEPQSGQDHIISPAFIFNQITETELDLNSEEKDVGSYYSDAIDLLQRIGAATWDQVPYDDDDWTSWPSETAFRQAPLHRSNSETYDSGSDWQLDYYWMYIETDEDIAIIRALLSNNIPVVISIDANQYSDLDSEETWTVSNYDDSTGTNHANTIVGYFDE